MALTLTIVDHWSDGKRIHVVGSIAISGVYVAGGDPVPLSDPKIKTGPKGIVIVPAMAYSADGDSTNRFIFTQVGGVVKMRTLGAGGAEPAGGAAYTASMIAHPPLFYGIFHKLV